MPEPLVLRERDGDVVTLTFNDPERRNAMTQAMGEAFSAQIAELAGDASLRAVVLTGAGRGFSAGGDLGMIGSHAKRGAERPGAARAPLRDTMRGFYALFLSVRDLPCPSVAAIHGAAIGAGLCVALACDLRVASTQAKLGLNFTRLGLHPGMGATWTLPRLVGTARAAELLYSGRILSGKEAAAIGLVNRAVEPEAVVPTARELAQEIAGSAPLAVRGVKRTLARSAQATLEDQLGFEADEQAGCFESEDVREGLAAIREKRVPRFQGR
ncbi:MAG: enoyl-CoA hydratase-related protein [Myxococcota bacterium]